MSFSSAAAGRYAQVVSSRANNPSFIYTPKELVLSVSFPLLRVPSAAH